MIYLVHGPQQLRIRSKINEILEKNLEEVNEFTSSYCDVEEMSIQDIISDVLTLPFGYEKKVVVVKNPYFLSAAKEPKLDFEQDFSALDKFIENNEPTAILVLSYVGKIDERKSLVKKIKNAGIEYAISDVDKNSCFDYAKRVFAEKHIIIDSNTLEFFLSRVGNDLGFIEREAEKLSLYSKNITYHDVELLIAKPLEENSYQLIDAIVNRNLKYAFEIYYDLKTQNEEPIRIITTISNQLHLQYQVNSLLKIGNSEKQIADFLSIHPYRVKLMIGKSRKLINGDILYILDKMAKLDIEIKTGQNDRYQALELFLLKIV